jgi:flagellar FliL protein
MAEEIEKPDKPKDTESTTETTRRSRRSILLSAVVLVCGAVVGAWYLGMLPGMAGGGRHLEATAAVPESQKAGEQEASGEHGSPGPLLALEPFIANLADESDTRYLKATFQVEFLGTTVPPGVDARLPQIRDLLLTLLTSKTFAEIRTPEGKEQLRDEIIARINGVLMRDIVKTVYFTEFIVQ